MEEDLTTQVNKVLDLLNQKADTLNYNYPTRFRNIFLYHGLSSDALEWSAHRYMDALNEDNSDQNLYSSYFTWLIVF